MGWYCDYAIGDAVHGDYHDTEYGFPETDESRLFERLTMEIMQAGLNWGLILKKRTGLNRAFDGFNVDRVASYDQADGTRLMADEGIVRNRLKVNAVIHNARVLKELRDLHGGFAQWIASNHPLTKRDWIRLFKRTFKFTGGDITGEFLMSIGYLPGAHREDCPAQQRILAIGPPWMSVGIDFYDA